MAIELAEDIIREDYIAYLEKNVTIDVTTENGSLIRITIDDDLRDLLILYIDFFFEELAGDTPEIFAAFLASYELMVADEYINILDLYYAIGCYLYGLAIYTHFLQVLTDEQVIRLRNNVRPSADDLFDSKDKS